MVKHGRFTILSLFLFFVLGLNFPTADAQTIRYVNRTDATCGGRSPCYTTIQAAIDAASSRDTIRIQAGTYSEQLQIQKNDFASATESDRIIIEADPAAPPGAVILTGSPGPQCTDKYAIRLMQSRYVTIRDLTITGTGAQAISLLGGNNGNVGTSPATGFSATAATPATAA